MFAFKVNLIGGFMSTASLVFDIYDKDVSIRILKSSHKILRDISLDKHLPVKYVIDDIISDYFRRLRRRSLHGHTKKRNRKLDN